MQQARRYGCGPDMCSISDICNWIMQGQNDKSRDVSLFLLLWSRQLCSCGSSWKVLWLVVHCKYFVGNFHIFEQAQHV